MIISFSVFKDKIESGEKKQTIRKYSEKRYKQFCNAKKYQLYWGNPRNGGTKIKEVEPKELPFVIQFIQRDSFVGKNNRFRRSIINILNDQTGEWISEYELSKLDGFESTLDMDDWFREHYGERMFTEKFMVIRWK